MNKRIEQFAEQARSFATSKPGLDNRDIFLQHFHSKFAEMIVNAVFDEIADDRYTMPEDLIERVKSSFGIVVKDIE